MSNNLVFGVGLNNANYRVVHKEDLPKVNGKRKRKLVWACPFYLKWQAMLTRCYSKAYLNSRPSYKGCTVCEEWLTFSNFRKWMITKEWEGMQLDKDLLVLGNKVYSPETCVFVDRKINNFLTDSGKARGDHLIGVFWCKRDKWLIAQVSNPMSGRRENLGFFSTEIEAHLAWKKRKCELAFELSNSEYVIEEKVKIALRLRYENYTFVEYLLS